MLQRGLLLSLLAVSLPAVSAYSNVGSIALDPQTLFGIQAPDRPKDCPPCFNCLLPAFKCYQGSECSPNDGMCQCPPGFGGQDCKEPVCGALSDGFNRTIREGPTCDCKDGWDGINCNVCENDSVCDALMPEKKDGVCYKGGVTVKQNYQQCDVVNRKIVDILEGKKPQVTFSCVKDEEDVNSKCDFQFWVDQQESFYCGLSECDWKFEPSHDRNITSYDCKKIHCECIPGRMLCGQDGSINLDEFLEEAIRGPASFECDSSRKGDECHFSEPEMNNMIKDVFGDPMIYLKCDSGECLHKTQVPGYTRPIKKINKPLIAGVIAGVSLLVVAAALGVYYYSRKVNRQAGLGPIHLDEDDEGSKLMTDHQPAALQFENISYNVNGKQILTNIIGSVKPGEVMAIMGPSGAGKTSFLDILARKNKRGTVAGDVYVNGVRVSDNDFRDVIGFVDQDDTMMATLTVYETILNSALLRLPKDMALSAKKRRVMDVITQLGIYHIRDSLIGSEEGERGISGGEKRRVSIACELVTSPSILFLDEPTSGLDSFNAYNVIESLVNLAKSYKRTVIFTIHQPRSNIVALFDELVLLARGRVVYSGAYAKCQQYFADLGYACPPGFNIADYLVDLTMHAAKTHGDSSASESTSLADGEAGASDAYARPTIVTRSRTEPPKRPNRKRGDSIRALQERQLFTRRVAPAQEELPLLDDSIVWRSEHSSLRDEATREWERQRSSFEEPDNSPPAAPNSQAGESDLDLLIKAYDVSILHENIHADIVTAVANASGSDPDSDDSEALQPISPMKGFKKVGWVGQFSILSGRTWKNLYRNPMLMLTHYAIAIVLAVLCGSLFYGITDDIAGFQNRMGVFFFVLALFGFSTLTSLNVFAAERLLFVRERANGYYHPITYFAAKVIFDIIPLRLIPPIILGSIIYPMIGLVAEWPTFFKFILVIVLFNLAAAAVCLFIGIAVKDQGVASLVGVLVMLFSLLFAGLLLNHDTIPAMALWLQQISIFHYAFEALLVNEVTYLTLIQHKFGIDIEVPGATILSTFGFDAAAYWSDVFGLVGFSGGFIVLAYLAMHFLLVERR